MDQYKTKMLLGQQQACKQLFSCKTTNHFLVNHQDGWATLNQPVKTSFVFLMVWSLVTSDSEAQEKLEKYIKWAEQEELYYKEKYAESQEAILFVYINNNVQNEGSLLASQTHPLPTGFCCGI